MMVIAVGLNPALDRILIVPGFAVGQTLKAESVHVLPSGKGTNVAAVLSLLCVPVRYVGFVGAQEVAAYRARLNRIPCDLVELDGRTRTDTTIIDPGQSETHVREPGFEVTPEHVAAFINRLAVSLARGDLVMLSGSLPPGAPADAYARIIEACRARGAQSFLDTSGEPLRRGAAAVPDFMKPNREELEELVGHPIGDEHGADDATIVAAARELIGCGVKAVAVTLGGDGGILVDGDTSGVEAWRGRAEAPEVVNTVGCGDALASGWMAARLAGGASAEQLREALALGAANAMTHGAGVIRADHIALMRRRAVVRRIESR